MLAEGQVQLRDLVMGRGTSYYFVTHFNPLARTARADQTGPRAWADGQWSGAEWTDATVIAMRLAVMGGTGAAGWMAAMRAMLNAFAPSSTDLPLTFALGGGQYVMFGRPRLAEPEARLKDGTGYVNAAFVAIDPHMYSSTLHTVGPIGVSTFTGGLQISTTVPFTIGASASGGSAVLANAGDIDTPLTIRLDGPLSAPSVALQRPDGVTQTLVTALNLLAGQFLLVDTGAGTALADGDPAASRRGSVGGDFPLLPKGTSTVYLFDAAGSAGTLTVSWRDAWQ